AMNAWACLASTSTPTDRPLGANSSMRSLSWLATLTSSNGRILAVQSSHKYAAYILTCTAIQFQSNLSNVASREWCHQPYAAFAVACSSSDVNAPSAQSVGIPNPKKDVSPILSALCHFKALLRRIRLSTLRWNSRNSNDECVDHSVVPSIAG